MTAVGAMSPASLSDLELKSKDISEEVIGSSKLPGRLKPESDFFRVAMTRFFVGAFTPP